MVIAGPALETVAVGLALEAEAAFPALSDAEPAATVKPIVPVPMQDEIVTVRVVVPVPLTFLVQPAVAVPVKVISLAARVTASAPE
jgi:hypothetical protein